MAGEKRSANEAEEILRDEAAIILDIEGTTSSISFVKDTLFPYIRECLKQHVDEKWDTEEFKDDLAKLREQAKNDEKKELEGFVAIKDSPDDDVKESLIKNVLWQMDNDFKNGALKQLQGHIWKAGHKPIKGHVYDEVPKAFEEWTNMGKKLYIYSSGSVEAQKLLFGDSVHGNLLKYISDHFDTEVGPKQEADSYKNILKKIGFEPAQVLFLTDVAKEAEAAKAAGLSVILVIREGNAELSTEEKSTFKTIHSFAELSFQSVCKKPKLDTESVSEKEESLNKETETATDETSKTEAPVIDTPKVESPKKEAPKEENPKEEVPKAENTDSVKDTCEPMDTSEDVHVPEKESEKQNNGDVKEKEVESKTLNAPDTVEVTNDESQNTKAPMAEPMKTSEELEVKKSNENGKAEESKEVDVKENKDVNEKKETESVVDNKADELQKANKAPNEEVPAEAESEKVAKEKIVDEVKTTKNSVVEEITEKVAKDVADDSVKDTKENVTKNETDKKVSDTTEVTKKDEETKKNGEIETPDSKKIEDANKSEDTQIKDKDLKQVEDAQKADEKVSPDTEVVKESKDNESGQAKAVEKIENNIEKEDEKQKINGTTENSNGTLDAEVVQKNGVTDKTESSENGESEESIKVKKAVADGAGEPEAVSSPTVAATS